MDEFELKKQFRWTIEIPGVDPYALVSIKLRPDGYTWHTAVVRLSCLTNRKMGVSPVEQGKGAALLKVLDKNGEVIDSFPLVWMSSDYTPFLDLDYTSSDLILSELRLFRVRFSEE
jgi:hypothetical protein